MIYIMLFFLRINMEVLFNPNVTSNFLNSDIQDNILSAETTRIEVLNYMLLLNNIRFALKCT